MDEKLEKQREKQRRKRGKWVFNMLGENAIFRGDWKLPFYLWKSISFIKSCILIFISCFSCKYLSCFQLSWSLWQFWFSFQKQHCMYTQCQTRSRVKEWVILVLSEYFMSLKVISTWQVCHIYLFLMLCGEAGGMGGVSTFKSWDNINIFWEWLKFALMGNWPNMPLYC